MTVAVRKTDLDAHNRAIKMSDAELASATREMLGAKLTAYLGGVKNTRTVSQWADGVVQIRNSNARGRLVLAYRVAILISERDSARVAQSWFQGMNPMLDDQAPARVLVNADPAGKDAAHVLTAARQFAAVG
ncbi:hypothetical protein [Gordonia zhaorongruii]|uniref:hypothetical protein n=1 Tax=Gordonia zhaorongruii TaxID=2597659 RepID=UPI0010511C9D|nr:hypothetical protein [Gordonia zhaorongruii]